MCFPPPRIPSPLSIPQTLSPSPILIPNPFSFFYYLIFLYMHPYPYLYPLPLFFIPSLTPTPPLLPSLTTIIILMIITLINLIITIVSADLKPHLFLNPHPHPNSHPLSQPIPYRTYSSITYLILFLIIASTPYSYISSLSPIEYPILITFYIQKNIYQTYHIICMGISVCILIPLSLPSSLFSNVFVF